MNRHDVSLATRLSRFGVDIETAFMWYYLTEINHSSLAPLVLIVGLVLAGVIACFE